MATRISLSNCFGMEPIFVPDNMPHDELLLEMERFAAEADAAMGKWMPDNTIVVRAWPNDRFVASECVEYRHTRQRYDADTVAALIAEDARVRS